MTIAEKLDRAKSDYDDVRAAGYAVGKIDGITEGYDQGVGDGYDNGRAQGIVEGKRAERKHNWDIILGNGKRTSYERAFAMGYSFDNFYPNHDIRVVGSASYTFIGWNDDDGKSPNHEGSLSERLKECGVALDISKCTNAAAMFSYTWFTELPLLDFSSMNNTATTGRQVFYYSNKLRKIEKIIVHKNLHYGQWFTRATSLTDLIVEGPVANDIDFKDCPLAKNSIISVMNALSVDVTGKTATFNASSVNSAFETSAGASDGSTSAEWAALISTRSNWTISLFV